MAAKKPDDAGGITEILKIEKGTIEAHILGLSPLIFNRPSEKTKHELLLPQGRKTAADRASSLKHEPREEYRASVYRFRDADTPTLLYHLASAFKGALSTAALDIPGAKKAQVGRLVWVEGDHIPIYGVPQLFMAIVRLADMARTPDVRTRAIVPQWACKLRISYIQQLIKPQAVANLLGAGGLTVGVGDYRAEKGKGNYGQFEIVDPSDERWVALQARGRTVQQTALDTPTCYDDETESLLAWFDTELERRRSLGTVERVPGKRMKHTPGIGKSHPGTNGRDAELS